MILILSGFVLYSGRVIWYRASGATPQIKSSWMRFSFPGHPEAVTSSILISGVMSVLCSRFVNSRNSFIHCLPVNTAFPSEALASRSGTIYFSAINVLVQFKNWLTAPCCILGLGYKRVKKMSACVLDTVLYRNISLF